ncbi:von Willebrand factor type A protein [Gracilaria domingensis]|nr:von Willebrand factor type A protein [Gracilaria domingensis]
MRDAIFLIDASNSTRNALHAVKPQLIQLLRNVSQTYNVGVGIYGSEQSFDARGFSVIQTVTSNVEEAVQALDNIPLLPDGPRSSMQALATLVGVRTVTGAVESFGFRSRNKMFILVGDTPGREVPCDASFYTNIRQMLRIGNIAAVSIGSPGLNAALPPLHCESSAIPEARAPIQEGQAADMIHGEVVHPPVTFEALFRAYDQSRRFPPPRGFFPNYGRNVWVTQNATTSRFGFFQMPVPLPLSDGCNERVQLSTPVPWPQPLQVPTQEMGTVRLSVEPLACRNGSFTCEVVIKDARRGQFSTPSSPRLDGHVHVVKNVTEFLNAVGEI